MKILLDECLNWRLKRELVGHEVSTVQDMGWSGIVNGRLLNLASRAGFRVFVTIDKNLPYQQNAEAQNLAIAILETRLNRLEYIRPLMPTLARLLPEMQSGKVYEIR
jgi:predicted nuclease of predicted toxin-antitoxin system